MVSERSAPLVIGLGGTRWPDASSERALGIALATARRLGAAIELFGAGEMSLPRYVPGAGPRAPGAMYLIDRISAADGVMIATSAFRGEMSGLLKNALDHIEDLRDDARPYLDGRAVGCIVCASGAAPAATTLSSMRSAVHALRGWPTPLGVVIDMEPSRAEGGDAVADAASQLRVMAGQVTEFARSHSIDRRRQMTTAGRWQA
jgi:FMN reductase